MQNIFLDYTDEELEDILEDQLVDKSKDPYSALFNGVIVQALIDVCNDKSSKEKEEAAAWFFSSVVSVIENFETVCDLANVNSSRVRGFAFRILESKDKSKLRKHMSFLLHDH
tara:strand:- start:1973 stop:2311 length:339 start_codon:yes stop_codon:yes gene_type:complete